MTGTIAAEDEPRYKPQRVWVAVTATASAFCLAALLAWSASDASFRNASWITEVLLGIGRGDSKNPAEIANARPALKWHILGSRVALLLTLFGVGVSCTCALILLTIRRATAWRVLNCLLLMAAWIALLATRDAVDRWRMTRQVSAVMPQFEAAAAGLSNRWPDKSGEIPPDIKFWVAPSHPDVLMVREVEANPTQESLGLMITRGRNGIIRFDLAAAYDSEVEYRPNGTEPSAYTSGLGYPSPPVAWVHRFSNEWFLVQYAATDRD